MQSKITTKRGDHGETTALNGQTYSKAHPIIACTGAVDEARAQTALLQRILAAENDTEGQDLVPFLHWVLHAFFVIGTECSDPEKKHPEYRRAKLDQRALRKLEEAQLRLENEVNLPPAFIVGASTIPAAHADLACTTVRHLERSIIELHRAIPDFEPGIIPAFVNRLSDYLYILARWLEKGNHHPVDYSLLEPPPT
ncbi:MAG: ATP:cob(I)alamin adenosyltransferase [Candidatus Hydrogenedentota bacterium]